MIVCGDDELQNFSVAYDKEKTAFPSPNEAQICVCRTGNCQEIVFRDFHCFEARLL